MICRKCNEGKLSKEFPPFTLTDACNHPPLHCLRCVTKYWEQHKQCSQCGQEVAGASLNLRKCYGILDTLFPEIKCITDDDDYGAAGGSGKFTVIRLNGEAAEINYSPLLSIYGVKKIVQEHMSVTPEKQRLVYNGQELKDFGEDNVMATLTTYGVKAGATVHLMVLLYAIPSTLNKVVFDLNWGFPSSGLDFLDASALVFSGTSYIEVADWTHTNGIAGGSISHSGDVLDRGNRRGHHKIIVALHDLPSYVTHVFFTLSAWNSPTISHYKSPSLRFYEVSNPSKMLCTDQTKKAGHRQAIVMCSLCRSGGQWFVHGNGKLSNGNARYYGPLKDTIRELITTMAM